MFSLPISLIINFSSKRQIYFMNTYILLRHCKDDLAFLVQYYLLADDFSVRFFPSEVKNHDSSTSKKVSFS